MATIKKQGKGYQITVSAGYDINGRQIRKYLTWVPEPGMTKRQLEKELNRQAVLFEEQVRDGNICDGSIRFKEFSELFMQRHANPNLRKRHPTSIRLSWCASIRRSATSGSET